MLLLLTGWMNEGGQSSTGQLLDFMVETHPAFAKVSATASERDVHHYVLLGEMLQAMASEQEAPFLTALTKNVFLYPDLHGNCLTLSHRRI